MGRQITVTGIIHPLGWGCGFACDSTPTYDNPIIPYDGRTSGEIMVYRGIYKSLSMIDFTPLKGDMVQVPDEEGKLIEYVWDGSKWDDIGKLDIKEGNGIDIDYNKISVQVADDKVISNTEEGIGVIWSDYEQ